MVLGLLLGGLGALSVGIAPVLGAGAFSFVTQGLENIKETFFPSKTAQIKAETKLVTAKKELVKTYADNPTVPTVDNPANEKSEGWFKSFPSLWLILGGAILLNKVFK